VDIGFTHFAHSGIKHSRVIISRDSITTWSGCRATNLADIVSGSSSYLRSCLRLPCILKAGRQAGVDYVLSGSIDVIGQQVIIGWRLAAVESGVDHKVSAIVVPYEERTLEATVNANLKEFLSAWSGNIKSTDPFHLTFKTKSLAGTEN